jgi:predicted deacylase
MNPISLKSFVYEAQQRGPRVLILGAVHGNETCGPIGIQKFMDEMAVGQHKLLNGRVTFIPIVNEKAHALNVRFVDENLNRNVMPHQTPQNNEQAIMPDLCRHLSDCDVLLDIHSASETTPPYAFINATLHPHEIEYARHLGVAYAVTGWEDAYKKIGTYDETTSTGTTEYARKFGATALTIECGGHVDEFAPRVAYDAVINCLRYFEMIEGEAQPAANFTALKLENVFYKQAAGAHARQWRSFEPMAAGDILAQYETGGVITAQHDGVILLPRPNAPVGEEWIYTAQPLPRPS